MRSPLHLFPRLLRLLPLIAAPQQRRSSAVPCGCQLQYSIREPVCLTLRIERIPRPPGKRPCDPGRRWRHAEGAWQMSTESITPEVIQSLADKLDALTRTLTPEELQAFELVEAQ